MTWHAPSDLLAAYAGGDLGDVQASSTEAHLAACPQCRAEIAALVEETFLVRSWEAVEARLDAPRPGPAEATLVRVGIPEHTARLLGATPALRLSWLLACALVLAFAVWAASEREQGEYWFLVLAPLLPLAGVALAYGPDVDPTYEIGLAAPMRSFGLLLTRAIAVLAATGLMALAAGLVLDGAQWSAAAWLAPSLGLTLASLALSTRASPAAAFGGLAVLWMAGAGAGWRWAQEPLDLFGPSGQLCFVLLAAFAALVLARNADRFERRGGMT
jgi:anti-sigma factor RsiW